MPGILPLQETPPESWRSIRSYAANASADADDVCPDPETGASDAISRRSEPGKG